MPSVATCSTVGLLDGHPLLPAPTGHDRHLLAVGAVVLLPCVLASRLFLEVRERLTATRFGAWSGARPSAAVAVLAVVAAGSVAAFSDVAGNGLEALRHSAAGPTLGVAATLAVVKLVATAAALGTGAPGGVLTPTITVSAGWAALVLLGLGGLGIDTGPCGTAWWWRWPSASPWACARGSSPW